MKNSMNKLAASLLAIVMLATTAGCGSSQQEKETTTVAATTQQTTTEEKAAVYPENNLSKEEKVTLNVAFAEQASGRAWYDYVKDSFMEKFPNVTIKTVYSPKVDTIVQTKIAANNPDEMFDLASLAPFTYGPAGKIEPLNDLYERELYDTPGTKVKDIMIDGAWEGRTEIDGNIYSFPNTMWVGGLYYNKTFFKENGWNEDPKTWNEFLELCASIKAKGVAPLVFSGVYAGYATYVAGSNKCFEIAQINGNLDDFYKEFKTNPLHFYHYSPEMIKNWENLKELGKLGYFADGIPALNHTQSQMLVIQNKAAMVMSADWIDNEMKDAVPADFEWGYMNMTYNSDPNQVQWINGDFASPFMIWKDKAEINKKWAKEFLLWMLNMDCQIKALEWGGMLPIRKDIADDQEKMKNVKTAHKSLMIWMKDHKYRLENGSKKVNLTYALGPSSGQAWKDYFNTFILMAENKNSPTDAANGIKVNIQKAIEEGKKAAETAK